MAWIKLASLLVVLLGVGLFVAGRIGMLHGTPPNDLGVKDGRLKPPSLTPNSVSSQTLLHADHPMRVYAQIAPLPLRGSGAQTIAALTRLVEETPGGRVVEPIFLSYPVATASGSLVLGTKARILSAM